MAVARDAIAGMCAAVAEHAGAAVATLEVDLPDVPAQIPSIHFADGQALITAATGEQLEAEPDVAPAHERWLGTGRGASTAPSCCS